VLLVIGGDTHYKDKDDEKKHFLSDWARKAISHQFRAELLDGRSSFIFSWNNQHRPIHEEALLHYFDPNKKGQKFVYKPRPEKETPNIAPPAAVDIQQEVWLVNSILPLSYAGVDINFNRRPVSSVGRAPRPDQHSGSLNN